MTKRTTSKSMGPSSVDRTSLLHHVSRSWTVEAVAASSASPLRVSRRGRGQLLAGDVLAPRCAGARRGVQLDSPAAVLHRGAHAADRARAPFRAQPLACAAFPLGSAPNLKSV